MSFTVGVDNAVASGFTVNVSFTDGTATGGTDFNNAAQTLTFAGTAGESQTLTVPVTNDAIVEGNETFTVTLSPSTASVAGTTASVSNITVTDSASKDIVLAITPGTAGTYMGSQATGDMFDAAAAVTFLTADLDIWVNPGAVVPQDGKIEVRFVAAQMANF